MRLLEVSPQINNLSLGVYHLGFCPEQVVNEDSFRFLGIISKNREEWAIANIACMRASITIIPFFESLGPDGISFILNQTELTSICFEKRFF
jgi:long-chain acyl-CoA synthetase